MYSKFQQILKQPPLLETFGEFLNYSECLRLSEINSEFRKKMAPILAIKFEQIDAIEYYAEKNHKRTFFGIEDFSNTDYLHLSDEKSPIPVGIGQLKNLEMLRIMRMNHELPLDIFSCTNLDFFFVIGCNLRHIPTEIKFLINLTKLGLDSNQIKEISVELCQLINLESLSMNYNQISIIPAEIANLKKLKSLSLNNNYMVEIPIAMTHLNNLSDLYMNYNHITELSPEMAKLVNLEELWLLGNRIQTVPLELGQTLNLKIFAVDEDVGPLPENWPDYHVY